MATSPKPAPVTSSRSSSTRSENGARMKAPAARSGRVQALLAEDEIERRVGQRQRGGVGVQPLDLLVGRARDLEHGGVEVAARAAHARGDGARDDPGPGRHVERPVGGLRSGELVRERVPVADTGSLREDLVALASAGAATASSPAGDAIVHAIVAAGAHDPALAEAARRFWVERLELDAAIVDRAIERGEAPAGTDRVGVIEAVLGPVYFRLFITGEPPDRAFIERIVDTVVAGVSAGR